MLKKIRNPEVFQGNQRKKQYFEGWYYKLVSKDKQHSLALIPGISLNKVDSHTFVQIFYKYIIDGKYHLKTDYLRFSTETFQTKDQPFNLQIEDNYFSLKRLNLNLKQNIIVEGEIALGDFLSIRKTIFSPSIMGFFAYIPFMECNHGVISLNHGLMGSLKIDDRMIDFSGGKGYLEKDWGKSFPKKYVWMQANDFSDSTAFMFSYATIPFLGLYFKGLIVSLAHKGREYRFATYNFSRIKNIKKTENSFSCVIKRGKYKLVVQAISHQTKSLASPIKGVMKGQIRESLSGEISLKFYIKNQLVFEDKSLHSGLEIML